MHRSRACCHVLQKHLCGQQPALSTGVPVPAVTRGRLCGRPDTAAGVASLAHACAHVASPGGKSSTQAPAPGAVLWTAQRPVQPHGAHAPSTAMGAAHWFQWHAACLGARAPLPAQMSWMACWPVHTCLHRTSLTRAARACVRVLLGHSAQAYISRTNGLPAPCFSGFSAPLVTQ